MKADLAALLGGAGLAVATDAIAGAARPSQRVIGAGAGLVVAAAIYPAARVGRPVEHDVVRREWVAVTLTGAVLSAAIACRGGRGGRTLVATGWWRGTRSIRLAGAG